MPGYRHPPELTSEDWHDIVRGGTPVPSRTHYLKRRGIMPILGMIQAFQYMYVLSFMTAAIKKQEDDAALTLSKSKGGDRRTYAY